MTLGYTRTVNDIMGEDYGEFISNIKLKLKVDLNLYKEAQMKRRLTSLRNRRGFSKFEDYYQALDENHELLAEFVDRLTINVSEFFRNPKRWDALIEKAIPNLLQKTDTLTIWSAACSTGEEPYSLAILMEAYFPKVNYTILATDIDEKVLDQAKQSIYQQKALKKIPKGFVDS